MKTYKSNSLLLILKQTILSTLLMAFGFLATFSLQPVWANPDVNDSTITLELRRQLIENEIVESHLVDIETDDGVVTLSGTVNHLLAKDQAEEIAAEMRGVKEIHNDLVVKPVLRTDKAIKEDVIDALAVDPAADSYELKVSVENGIVELSGESESIPESHIAIQVAKSVKGVIGVINDIDIDYKLDRNRNEIKAEIQRSLELNPAVEEEQIDVRVSNGIVTLTGTVGSLAEKREASLEAWTTGVKKVNDTGLVVDWESAVAIIQSETDDFKTDREIRDDVEDALLLETQVPTDNVNVQVENAVVTLSGTVETYNAKQVAKQTAERIEGVTRVKNYLLVRFDPIPADDKIESMVREALVRDPIVSLSDVGVSVTNQKVYLTGVVDSLLEKQQAENVASRIIHVAEVENSIKLDHSWTWKRDVAIQEDVIDELFWSPFVDEDDITVRVEDGTAILTGRVTSWNEHSAAVENAFEGGASAVKSTLEITNFPGSEDYPRHYRYDTYFN